MLFEALVIHIKINLNTNKKLPSLPKKKRDRTQQQKKQPRLIEPSEKEEKENKNDASAKARKEREEKFFFLAIVWKKLARNARSKRLNDYSTTTTITSAEHASVQKQKRKEIESKPSTVRKEYQEN